MSQLVINRLFDTSLSSLDSNYVKHFHFNLGAAERKIWYRKITFPFSRLYSIESVIILVLFDEERRGEEKLPRISGRATAGKKCRLLRIVKRVESLVDPLVDAAIRGRIISAWNRSDWTVLSLGKFWRNCSKIGWIGFSLTPICLFVYRDDLSSMNFFLLETSYPSCSK